MISYPYVLDGLLEPVIPEPIVKPEFDELQWRLGAKSVFCRHVEIIHEGDHLLASHWYVYTLCPFLHPTFNDVLHIIGACLHKIR